MNEAKTVLFAISMDGVGAEQAKKFEDKTMLAIRSGNRDYYNSNSIHCDYKDGLLQMCQQFHPSAAVINELLPGMGNIFEIVKEMKSEFPEIVIVMLFKDNRVVGDAVLANLTASGIYNWVSAPWKPETIASLITSPKKMKDVEAYIPKIIEGANGLAFETKLVERVEDNLNDLASPSLEGSSNALAVDGRIDDITQHKENLEVGYHKVVGKGFLGGFGNRAKTNTSGISLSVKANNEEKPKQEENKTSNLFSNSNEISVNKIPAVEEKKAEPKEIVKTKVVENMVKDVLEQKEKAERSLNIEKKNLLDKIDINKEDLSTKKLDNSEIFKETVPSKENPDQNKKKETKLLSLNEFNFEPKYNKVLFVRALPLSTIFPIHLARLSKAAFVDFNKESCYDGFEDVYKTTIKEAKLPDNERIVADAVAGNGIEKIAEKFDYVIAILPEDDYAINIFLKRYPNLADFVLIQNSAKIIDFRKIGNIFGSKVKAMSFLNEKTSMIRTALVEKVLLMNNPDYAKSVNFIVKTLGK